VIELIRRKQAHEPMASSCSLKCARARCASDRRSNPAQEFPYNEMMEGRLRDAVLRGFGRAVHSDV